jgi:hypothetical protein
MSLQTFSSHLGQSFLSVLNVGGSVDLMTTRAFLELAAILSMTVVILG